VNTFLIVCAVMVVAALVLLLVPLLREDKPVAKGEKPAMRAVPMAVALMIALPLAAAAIYGITSNYPWDNPTVLASGAAGHAQDAGSMEQVISQLEARLAKSPGDQEGWRMLGRSYLVTGRLQDAVNAYQKASAISGGKDPGVELDLAEALVLADDPARQPKAKAIIDAALAADPGNQKALWYSGLMARRADDPETAKMQWTKLLEANPPPEIRQILVAQLEQLGVVVPASASAPSPSGGMAMGMGAAGADAGATPSGRTIRVAVSVDPSLAASLRPGSVVFVSAREAGIPGPPLAAVRLSSDDLPTTVVLSDANAMVEGRNLSSVDEVQVVARVAYGGTAVTASGDLVGEARHTKAQAPDLSVVIDKVAP
jgi:cytochrome c-type biogenesis protein CcmH